MLTLLFALALPAWLELPAGADVKNTTPTQVEASYTAAGEPADVAADLSKLFAKANVSFAANDDGIGLSGRAAAPECDLLLQFRPASQGTRVRIYCTAKSGDLFGASVAQGSRQTAYRARQVSTAPTGRSERPRIDWPSWFGPIGADRELNPEPTVINGLYCLRSEYKVNADQKTAIYEGYQRLFQAHGYTISKAVTRTGNTISGRVVENFYAYVEGVQSPGGTRAGASSVVSAVYSRQQMNGYVPVGLAVCAGNGQ